MAIQFCLICCVVFLKFSGFLVAATLWNTSLDADHYWSMNRIHYRYLYDRSRQGVQRWHAYIRGASEVIQSSANLGIRLYGSYSWIDLGYRKNSCFVDVVNCPNGLSIAFWVKSYQRGIRQVLLVFGGTNRGLTFIKTKDDVLETRLSSEEMRKSWTVTSNDRIFETSAWHHVAITWNSTNGLTLYVNGTRLENNGSVMSLNQSRTFSTSWSMYIGRDVHAMAVDELFLWSNVVSDDKISKTYKYKTGIPASNVGCVFPWIAGNLQFCYQAFNTSLSWNDAHSFCQRYSSNLISIVSQEEDDFIKKTKTLQSPCTYLGLKGTQGSFCWSDHSIWGFSRLVNQGNNSFKNSTMCVYRNQTNGLWYTTDCQKRCGFICKRYRAGIFRNANFYCRAKLFDKGISGYRLSITKVRSEIECATECLIYGNGCLSYNYQKYTTRYPQETDLHLCELNGSRNHAHLAEKDGYQYCERK